MQGFFHPLDLSLRFLRREEEALASLFVVRWGGLIYYVKAGWLLIDLAIGLHPIDATTSTCFPEGPWLGDETMLYLIHTS
jgi:hypothetical protein